MLKNILIGSFILFSLIFVLFFYGDEPQQSSTVIKKDVSIGIAQEALAALAIIAEVKGLFSQQGLNVTITQYKGGKQALVNGLLAGKVDMVTTADVPIVINNFSHDFKIVATIGSNDNGPKIIARRDSHILFPDDLAGKNIATKKGSAVHFFLNQFLIHSQISENKITTSFVENGDEMVGLLTSGKIDAFSHREPFIGKAKSILGDNAIVFSKPGIYIKTYNLVVSNKLIKNNPAVIERTLKALLMAEKYLIKYPVEARRLVTQYIGAEEDDLISVWQNMDLNMGMNQTLIITLEAQAKWAINHQLIDTDEVPNYLDSIDLYFLNKVKPDSINLYAK